MRLGAEIKAHNLAPSGPRGTQQMSVPDVDVPFARERKSENAAGGFVPSGHDAWDGHDTPPSPLPLPNGYGILPREAMASLVDMDDPILDGMFEDESGRISVQC